MMLHTWSFVLKQRGLSHEDGERVKGKACFLYAPLVLPCAQHLNDVQLGPLRSGEDVIVFGILRPGDSHATFTAMRY
jgi:hypothetical protein